MKHFILLEGLSEEATALIAAFVDEGGCQVPAETGRWVSPWEREALAKKLAGLDFWDAEHRLCARFLLSLGAATHDCSFLRNFSGARESDLIGVMEDTEDAPDPKALAQAILASHLTDWQPAENPVSERPFRSPFANLAWVHGDFQQPFSSGGLVFLTLHAFRPDLIPSWIGQWPAATLIPGDEWYQLAQITDQYDEALVAKLGHVIDEVADNYRKTDAFKLMVKIDRLRDGAYRAKLVEWALHPDLPPSDEVVELLASERPDAACLVAMGKGNPYFGRDWKVLFRLAIRDMDGDGGRLLERELSSEYIGLRGDSALEILLTESPRELQDKALELIRKGCEKRIHGTSRSQTGKPDYWKEIAKYPAAWLAPEMWNLLCGTNHMLRGIAAKWLISNIPEEAAVLAKSLRESTKPNERIGAANVLSAMGGESAILELKTWHGSEASKPVREVIALLLTDHKEVVAPEPKKQVEGYGDFDDFEKRLAANPKSVKPPKAPWLSTGSLPPLYTHHGKELSELARTFIFQRQAREAGGTIHEEVVPMLAHLDRVKNAAFAHALLDQWFASDMKAPTRWALDVAGIVGDDSIIERLTQPISRWCQENRGSRAEWAAHAIALLGTEGALATLDGLIEKYRTKRKYVAEAAGVAIHTAAGALGISDDELSERLVSTFGFDSGGCHDFEVARGKVIAVLDTDFKIGWKGHRPGEILKNPPATLTPEAEAELKEIRKFLKDAVTRQLQRLQNAMISRRRWDIATWRKRFESHAVFRIIAMRLIWGTYDEAGTLLNTFRLYPNGLTASADGTLEEFSPPVAGIAIIHGLELDAKTKKEWAAHLSRFKVKPLFKQLNRPTHILDPLHGNRSELRMTDGVKTTAGKLRAELFARGWSQGSTGDGGWIACMFRKFPACGIDVYLPMEQFHAASSKDDQVVLGSAFFARGATGPKSYRDRHEEAEAIPFNQVPPIVYSETVADLAIISEAKE